MVLEVDVTARLAVIEEALASHCVFGDSAYIHGQLRLCLARRLKRVATRLPIAEQLVEVLEQQPDSDGLRRLVGDSVFRCAVLHAHTQTETGQPCGLSLDDCAAIFEAALRRLESGSVDTPLQDGTLLPMGAASYLGWVWTDEHPDDIFGRSFRYLVGDHYRALPLTPTPEELATLSSGVELLQTLLPSLAPSALSHAHVVSCVPSAGAWTGMASGSNFQLGGAVFLGRTMTNAWWVAEHLLHEAMHQKLYDFRHGHSLLALGVPRDAAPRVWSPWNACRLDRANYWDTNRVFAAFHVYVHVALLAMLAEERAAELEGRFGVLDGVTRSRTALDRAWYLGHRLTEQCRAQLGEAGQAMHGWLMSALEFLDPEPPPADAYLHFAMDVYRRDAAELATLLEDGTASSGPLLHGLASLARHEIERSEGLLEATESPGARVALTAAVGSWEEGQLGRRFPEVRGHIAATLLSASANGCSFGDARVDRMAEDLFEVAGSSLYALMQGIPPLVAEARRRASRMAFPMSSRDDTGRLLRTLAGAVPPGGRILEIGTGTGVGVAWMVDGLGARDDVELVSVEIQPSLARATRDGTPWPPYVRLLNEDAAQALPNLGSFHLVFADAAPVKYGGLDAVIAALEPGGLLMIDDFRASEHTSDSRRQEIEAMRRAVLQHVQLNAVELDWSSGIILASRRAPGH